MRFVESSSFVLLGVGRGTAQIGLTRHHLLNCAQLVCERLFVFCISSVGETVDLIGSASSKQQESISFLVDQTQSGASWQGEMKWAAAQFGIPQATKRLRCGGGVGVVSGLPHIRSET